VLPALYAIMYAVTMLISHRIHTMLAYTNPMQYAQNICVKCTHGMHKTVCAMCAHMTSAMTDKLSVFLM